MLDVVFEGRRWKRSKCYDFYQYYFRVKIESDSFREFGDLKDNAPDGIFEAYLKMREREY